MVTWFAPLFGPACGVVACARAKDAASARRIGALASLVGLAGATIAMVLALVDTHGHTAREPWEALLPVVVNGIGLVAVAMNPLSGSSPATFSRILATIAVSLALVMVQQKVAMLVLWIASMVPAYLELRATPLTRGFSRVFACYMSASALLVVTGGGLVLAGDRETGALLMLASIAVRKAFVPLHSWFPAFAERAPAGLVVAFASPQLGVCLHLRWLSADAPWHLGGVIAAFGAFTALFAAALGTVQARARRAAGYLMMSQTALVSFGLHESSQVARVGAIAMWLVVGLATAGFIMVMGALESRRGPLSLLRPGGNLERVPLLATAFLVLGLASVGLPFTFGYVAEDLLFQGSVNEYPVLAFALIVATALNGITVMRAYFLLFKGTRQHAGERDLVPREWAVLTALLLVLVTSGLLPGRLLSWMSHAAEVHVEAPQ